jgi:hypothetical protein
MTAGKTESFDRQLDSYRAISQHRTRAVEHVDDGPTWMRFAAAAGASLAGAATADAAITHVVPPSPIRVEVYSGSSTSINLDGGLDVDLQLAALYSDASPTYYGYRYAGVAYGINNAKLIGDEPIGPFGNIAVHKFTAGSVIPAVEPAMEGYLLQVSATSSSNIATYAGQWGISGTGFAGFVNGPVGSRRAGWIKIRMEPSAGRLGAIEVLEWAYQTVAGVSIMAGQTSVGPILGDYNNNGSVGPEDYIVWKNTFGNAVAAGTGADGNSNGEVEIGDYTVWRNHLGEPGGGSLAGAVPEPSTVTLGVLALGAAGVAALRRKSK